MREEFAVLDLGSGKINFVVGVKSVDNIFFVKNFATAEYSGYFNGEWIAPELLKNDIAEVIKKSKFNYKIKTLFVAVPSEFTFARTSGILSDAGRSKTVTSSTIKDIHKKADAFKVKGYTALCSSAIEYVLDGSRRTLHPIGEIAKNVYANMSYIFCKEEFIARIYKIAMELGFKYVRFVDGIWAEGTQLIDEDTRIDDVVMIDVGYASTTFTLIKGEGIKYKKDYPFGSGFIIDALAKALEVEYDVAKSLMGKVTLNIESDSTSVYQYEIGNRKYECSAKEINSFLHGYILENLVDFINACIKEVKSNDELSVAQNSFDGAAGYSITPDTRFYLVGGGLSEYRGAANFFARALGRDVSLITADTAGWDKPYFASMFATLEIADKMSQKNSILERLFR
ncbi:MAG: hypothetical protein K2G37_02195 [Clostridia bacterium]|nr:hypothetical protein [Clostridia bacterium]MDE7328337.1 hypothetical protein [Clostridia bacterium]